MHAGTASHREVCRFAGMSVFCQPLTSFSHHSSFQYMALHSNNPAPKSGSAIDRIWGTALISLLLPLMIGCQLYSPSPLNPTGHAQDWHERRPSDEKIIDFARRLEASAPRSVQFNPSDGLTLAEAEIVALVYNPDLRLARLKADVAKASAQYAGRWDDPELSIDVLKVTESVPHPWVVGSSLSLTIPVSGRLEVEKARAEAFKHAELARVSEEEWKIIITLCESWLTWSADLIRLQESESMLKSLDGFVTTTSQLEDVGEMPRTESALFKIEHETRKSDVARLRGKVKEGEQEIRSVLGISPTAPVTFIPTMAVPRSGKSRDLSITNPTLVRLQNEYEVAELTLLREIRKQFPDLEIGPSFEDDQGQSKIGVVGAIPIPILNSNKGGIAAARAEREVARAAFETELERQEGRHAVLEAQLEGTQARRRSMEKDVVPLVDSQMQDARQLLELGEGGSLVILESIVRAHTTRLDLVEARLEESHAANQIRSVHGPDRLSAKTK